MPVFRPAPGGFAATLGKNLDLATLGQSVKDLMRYGFRKNKEKTSDSIQSKIQLRKENSN